MHESPETTTPNMTTTTIEKKPVTAADRSALLEQVLGFPVDVHTGA